MGGGARKLGDLESWDGGDLESLGTWKAGETRENLGEGDGGGLKNWGWGWTGKTWWTVESWGGVRKLGGGGGVPWALES